MISSFGKKTVGIVGLGTAGTAAAIFLARQGHQIKVFEKTTAEAANGYVGAGIGMQPIGLTVLRRLGVPLLDSVLSHGHRIDRLLGTNPRGKTVLDVSYGDLDPKLFGLGLHRAVLFHDLLTMADAYPNIEIAYGHDVVSAHVEGTETELISRVHKAPSINSSSGSGSFLVDAQGNVEGASIVLHSHTNQMIFGFLFRTVDIHVYRPFRHDCVC